MPKIYGLIVNYEVFVKKENAKFEVDLQSFGKGNLTPKAQDLFTQIKIEYAKKLMSYGNMIGISSVFLTDQGVDIILDQKIPISPSRTQLFDVFLQETYNLLMEIPEYESPKYDDYFYSSDVDGFDYRVIKYKNISPISPFAFGGMSYEFIVFQYMASTGSYEGIQYTKPQFNALVKNGTLIPFEIVNKGDYFENEAGENFLVDTVVIQDPNNIQYKTVVYYTFGSEKSKGTLLNIFQERLLDGRFWWESNYELFLKKPESVVGLGKNTNEESSSEVGIQPNMNEKGLLEQYKNEVSQLVFLRTIVSPIDFEQKIKISQLITEKQKKIDELNFKVLESKLAKEDIFDDLFEQSFIPIQGTYTGVFTTMESPNDFFTPNGQKSLLSEELNELIRTPQFIEWFGNWQLAFIYKNDEMELDCSKVLTENFEPLVVWHGTGQEFSYFRFDNFPAAYFAVKQEYSQWFANLHGEDGGYTIPFFLNIRNPLDLTHFGSKKVSVKDFFDFLYLKTGLSIDDLNVNPIFLDSKFPEQQVWVFIRNNPAMLKLISEKNIYDGIHFYETNPNVQEGEPEYETEAYITFSPNQSKIADPNRGLILASSLKSFLLKEGGKI